MTNPVDQPKELDAWPENVSDDTLSKAIEREADQIAIAVSPEVYNEIAGFLGTIRATAQTMLLRHKAHAAGLIASQPQATTVGVKALEWEELQTVPGKFVATTIIGRYERWGINWRLGNSMIRQEDSPEAAAKACQGDLDRIVRSALIGIPGAEKEEAVYSQADFDESYEIGKRDGYEEAIQDMDLATGGDGEFKGSTFPGETVDVPVMKARIIERFDFPPAPTSGAEKGEAVTQRIDHPNRPKEADYEAAQLKRRLAQFPDAVVETLTTWALMQPATGSYAGALWAIAEWAAARAAPTSERVQALDSAARAVIDQWDTPNWKLDEPTAAIINRLRAALKATP